MNKWLVKWLGWMICVLILACGCAPNLSRMTPFQRGELLAVERGRLIALSDPVRMTRSYIRIADILLTFVVDAVRERNVDEMNTLVDQYVGSVQLSHDTMVESDRDAVRRPEGFRDLEIALRGHIRQLQDIGLQVSVTERDKIIHAVETATTLRSEMLSRLFPQPPLGD